MSILENLGAVVVRQHKELGEVLTGIECRNNYAAMDEMGNPLFSAQEESSFLGRMFLKSNRPFTMDIVSANGELLFHLRRPFRFFFPGIEIYDAENHLLGTVEKRFSLLNRVFTVSVSGLSMEMRLFGPLLHPWTFRLQANGNEVGKITKRWDGVLREGFTDADTFGVSFPHELPEQVKKVLVGAVFLIDFAYFESRK